MWRSRQASLTVPKFFKNISQVRRSEDFSPSRIYRVAVAPRDTEVAGKSVWHPRVCLSFEKAFVSFIVLLPLLHKVSLPISNPGRECGPLHHAQQRLFFATDQQPLVSLDSASPSFVRGLENLPMSGGAISYNFFLLMLS